MLVFCWVLVGLGLSSRNNGNYRVGWGCMFIVCGFVVVCVKFGVGGWFSCVVFGC